MIDHLAIISLGSIGKRHLRLARELRPGMKIAVVRSGKGENAEEEKLANGVFYSLADAIDAGIDAAVIASPSVHHVVQANELLQAGVPVLVEKPLSNSMHHVNELVETLDKLKVTGLVGYCLRYDPAAIRFREKLSGDTIGKILHVQVDCGSYLPDWRPGQDYRQSASAKKKFGGGVLLEMSHELDYIRWFFGDIDFVSAKLVNSGTLDIDVEDSADMLFSSSQGFTISVHLDFNSRTNRRSCIARGTEGDLIWDAVSQKVAWTSTDEPDQVENFRHKRNYIYQEQLKHFLGCIENGQSPRVTFKDGASTLRIIEAVRKSNLTGTGVGVA